MARAQAPKKRAEDRAPSLRERFHRFAFENQSEKDRFGIFDPFLRLMYGIGLLLAIWLTGETLFEAASPASRTAALAVAFLFAVGSVAGGVWLYRTIWRAPTEREMLLQMAREDDESRRLLALRESGGRGAATKGSGEPSARQRNEVDGS